MEKDQDKEVLPETARGTEPGPEWGQARGMALGEDMEKDCLQNFSPLQAQGEALVLIRVTLTILSPPIREKPGRGDTREKFS